MIHKTERNKVSQRKGSPECPIVVGKLREKEVEKSLTEILTHQQRFEKRGNGQIAIWEKSIPGRGQAEQRPYVETHRHIGGTAKTGGWQACMNREESRGRGDCRRNGAGLCKPHSGSGRRNLVCTLKEMGSHCRVLSQGVVA